MDNNNHLLTLPLEIFFEITKNLTIFDLENLESSGLFELNENGISDKIQAAFEQLPEINIEYKDHDAEVITKLVLRCGTGLKSLMVKCRGRWTEGFLTAAHYSNKNFMKNLATRCPNIQKFAKSDFNECEDGAEESGLGHFIKNIKVSKLIEIDPTYLPNAVLPCLFTPNLKLLWFSDMERFMYSLEALNEVNPNFGSSIRQIITDKMCLSEALDVHDCLGDVKKLISFFPNLKTIQVKAAKRSFGDYGGFIYNREQMNKPNFVNQLELLAEYTLEYLPYINIESSENFDLSSIVKIESHIDHFDAAIYDQLINLQSLRLNGNQMMFDFSDYLSDASFKSLKRLDFTGLELDADAFAKFEKIVATGRFFINSIVKSYSINVHTILISLLGQFCRNIKKVNIELEPENIENPEQLTVTLNSEEKMMLNNLSIGDVSCVQPRHWKHHKQYKCNILIKKQEKSFAFW